MAGTALTYITRAFENLNVFQPGVTLPTAQANQALLMLNQMMGTWAQELTPPCSCTAVLPLAAGVRGYTWGPTQNITWPSPPTTQPRLRKATLTLGGTNPPVEVPLAVLTDDMYLDIPIKTQTSSQPTCVYYTIWFGELPQPPQFPGILVWPVPDNSLHTINLYFDWAFGPFADLNTTTYTFPQGYDEAIVYNLERRLAGPYGRDLPPEDALLARETFANIQRANLRLSDLENDFALHFGRGREGGYNILTGSGGGT